MRYDIQPFAHILANDVAGGAVTAGQLIRFNDLFDTRQVFWQYATSYATIWLCLLWRINRRISRVDLSYGRLDIFQCEMNLIRVRLLELRAKHRTLKVGDQLLKTINVHNLCGHHAHQ